MRFIIFRLSKYTLYSYDEAEKENIEERQILGYFNSIEEIKNSIWLCVKSGIDKNNLTVNAYSITLRKGQKYIYELSYSYSIQTTTGEYMDYEYIFDPQGNKLDCLKLKERLVRQPKFQPSSNKIFDSSMPDGFWIERYTINKLYTVIPLS